MSAPSQIVDLFDANALDDSSYPGGGGYKSAGCETYVDGSTTGNNWYHQWGIKNSSWNPTSPHIIADHQFKYDSADQKWKDVGNQNPVYITSRASDQNASSDTTTEAADNEYIDFWDISSNQQFTIISPYYSAPSGGQSGDPPSQPGSSYPPQRTSRYVVAGLGAVSWAWNTYSIYSTASGSNPIGGPGDGGWIYNLVSNDTVNEVTAEISVGGNNTEGATVNVGDELYIEFDEDHDDDSATPNYTITSEGTDQTDSNGDPISTNPSNTVNNVAVVANAATSIAIKIVSVSFPFGSIRVYIKEPDDMDGNPVVPSFVGEFVIKRKRARGNFW